MEWWETFPGVTSTYQYVMLELKSSSYLHQLYIIWSQFGTKLKLSPEVKTYVPEMDSNTRNLKIVARNWHGLVSGQIHWDFMLTFLQGQVSPFLFI